MDRAYEKQEGCPVAATLEVIGDRWTILLLRDLVTGRSGKFGDLMESLDGISTNLLSDRLKRLEEQGIVDAVLYNDHPPRSEYRLTKKGQDLAPVVRQLAEWGYKYRLSKKQKAAWKAPWK